MPLSPFPPHNLFPYMALPGQGGYGGDGLIKLDTKAKCRYVKKLTCKGTLRQVIIRVFRLEIQSVMFVFRPSFMNYRPSNPLSGSTLPPPESKYRSPVYTDSVWHGRGWGGGGGRIDFYSRPYSAWVEHSVSDQIRRTYKIARSPQLRKGGGLRQMNTCPFTDKFFYNDIWRCFLSV
jgi:hypothetical protein